MDIKMDNIAQEAEDIIFIFNPKFLKREISSQTVELDY